MIQQIDLHIWHIIGGGKADLPRYLAKLLVKIKQVGLYIRHIIAGDKTYSLRYLEAYSRTSYDIS